MAKVENSKADERKGVHETLGYVQRLAGDGFYGTLEVRFESGNIVHIIEHRSLKPFSLRTPDKLRSNHVADSEDSKL